LKNQSEEQQELTHTHSSISNKSTSASTRVRTRGVDARGVWAAVISTILARTLIPICEKKRRKTTSSENTQQTN